MFFSRFGLGIVGVLLFAGCATAKKAQTSKPAFEVQGHRGARSVRPENTMSGFRHALEVGADTLELDLLVTKDNILVIGHDPVLNPEICLGPGGRPLGKKPVLVRNLTLKQLKQYDCGTLVNPRFPRQVAQPGERMSTFEEFLTWLKTEKNPRARTVELNVEAKSELEFPTYAPHPKIFSTLILDALYRHGMLERTTIQSFDFRILLMVREQNGMIRTSVLLEKRPSKTLVQVITRLKAQVLSMNERWLTQRDVLALHKAGYKVIPWTANTESLWQRLADYGVDGIITDDPAGLVEFRSRWIRQATQD